MTRAKSTDSLCYNCNGSGEGMYDGTRCYVCKGAGTLPDSEDLEPNEEPEDNYDTEY